MLGGGRGISPLRLAAAGVVVGLVPVPAGVGFATPPPNPANSTSYFGSLRSCCGGPGSGFASEGNPESQPPYYPVDTLIGTRRPLRPADAGSLPGRHSATRAGFPAGIFEWVTSLNLLGFLPDGGGTAFTTPTANPIVAYDNARTLGRIVDDQCTVDGCAEELRPVWVYEIRADTSFYDVEESLRYHFAQPDVVQSVPPSTAQSVSSPAGSLQRWVPVGIPSANIRRANPITEATPAPVCSDPQIVEDESEPSRSQAPPPFSLDSAETNELFVMLNTRGSERLLTG